jgi:hypothetical protein
LQQQQQVLHPVEVPPIVLPPGTSRTNQLVEMLLQRPQLIKTPQQLEEGYIWQRLIMVRAWHSNATAADHGDSAAAACSCHLLPTVD